MALNWQSMEVWSDLVGLGSAVVMTVPAWKADSLTAFVAHLRAVLRPTAAPAAGNADPNADVVLDDLERDAAAWKPADRRLLRLGVLLLAASFALKMGHHAGWHF
jgi:hypothetical protein